MIRFQKQVPIIGNPIYRFNDKIYFILMDRKFESYGLKIINELRKKNLKVYFDYKYNLKKSLSKANQFNIKNVVIIGENEVNNKLCTLKNLRKNTQQTISIEQLIKDLIE